MSDPPDTPVLVVGQTPPPHGGQAIMIAALLEGDYRPVVLRHVRMDFSRTMEEMGRFRVSKVLRLFWLWRRIVRERRRSGARILYYPPAGPRMIPVLRDIALLLLLRPRFERTIFHFHAGGVGNFGNALPYPLRALFKRAFHEPEVAVHVSSFAPPDGATLGAAQCVVIPNGVRDPGPAAGRKDRQAKQIPPTILFVGLIGEAKGCDDLVAACGRLQQMGHEFQVRMVGAFASREEERRLRNRALRLGIDQFVEYAGVLTGAEKHSAYADAEIFCYPTHHESETFGLSVVEAMSFGLPVVATRWRGLAEIVVDGRTGHLVPVRDPTSLATKLRDLLLDSEKRARMGEEGRNRYCQQYSLEQFHRAFKTLFLEQVDHLDNGDR